MAVELEAELEPLARLIRLNAASCCWRAGEWMQFPGAVPNNVAFVTSGAARVVLCGADGHEMTLYRIESGEHCGLAAAAALAATPYPAAILAETDVTAVIWSACDLRRAVAQEEGIRLHILSSISQRTARLLSLIADIAFTPMDQRLASLLLDRAGGSEPLHPVTITHRELAAELGTAREVVSRLLETFQHAGAVQLERGRIQFASGAAAFLCAKASATGASRR